jgi:hypothetical protein
MGVWCKAYPGIDDPLISEALALRDARLGISVEFPPKLTVQNRCACGKLGCPVIAPLLKEVSERSLAIQTFDFSFARRSSNNSAHTCARYACLNNVSELRIMCQNSE